MKQHIINILIILGMVCSISGQESDKNLPFDSHPRGLKVMPILESLTQNGAPGTSLAIWDKDGWWMGSSGFSNLEKEEKMTDVHLQYLQSVAKTYMAVAILKLYEEGKLGLGDQITKHLDSNVTELVDRADEITIKMLLNHTSGIPEYNFHPDYASSLLQYPERVFKPIDYIQYIKGKKLTFEPGSQYAYRNTNYVLLSMIADKITGDHGAYMKKTIFEPLGLEPTYYQINDQKLRDEKLTSSYWDRYSDGHLEDISYVQKQNVTYMVGDDGIVTTPEEAVKFLKGLIGGKLLEKDTMEKMKTWVQDN